MFSNSCDFCWILVCTVCGFSTSISGVTLPRVTTTLVRDKLPKCIEMNFSLQKSFGISLWITSDNYRHQRASLDTMTCVQVTMLQAPPAQPQGPPAQAPPAQAPPAQAPPPQQAPPPAPIMGRPQVRNPDLRARKCAFDFRALTQCSLRWSMSGQHLEPAQAILYICTILTCTYCIHATSIHIQYILVYTSYFNIHQ